MRCRLCKKSPKVSILNEIWIGYVCKCGNRFVRVKKNFECYQNPNTRKIIERAITKFVRG